MSEEWRVYPSDPRIEASSHGRVRRIMPDGLIRVVAFTPSESHGYNDVATSIGSVRRHVIVCEAFHGPCPAGLECCHGDGDPRNNAPDNLRWDTHAANLADAVRHNAMIHGDCHHKSKLTSSEVAVIKRRLLDGDHPADIAKDYQATTVSNIWKIKYRRAWRRVEPAEFASNKEFK